MILILEFFACLHLDVFLYVQYFQNYFEGGSDPVST